MASAEEETPTTPMETNDQPKEVTTSASGNENFVVIDMAGDSGEDSDKDGRETKTEKVPKEEPTSDNEMDNENDTEAPKTPPPESDVKPVVAINTKLRKKPKAPVVDVTCLRKRKWQLKVYPLHTDDLQLNYHLCKLASESLLYIPSEGRHGKAELYVATQKDTATIIGKLLRMDFHHDMLSIEVVRKDTGSEKDDLDHSKKECKAFLMFDKFLSKKIFDAKFEKGMPHEKMVTLTKLPKEATRDFIGALFPFATDVEVFESDDIEERKATVTCKTPVTALLVHKSFKRLEINDVHVKISVDDSVKAIQLPPIFFTPPDKKTELTDGPAGLNKSSLAARRPPLMTSINRRAMLVKKRALITRRKPGFPMGGPPLLRTPKGLIMDDGMMGAPPPRRQMDGRWPMDPHGPGPRDFPPGPGRRRMMDDRGHDRESNERNRRRSEESQMTKEMLQLQNQLNQAIKNQIAMLNTSHGSSTRSDLPESRDSYAGSGGPSRASLLGHGPRQYGMGAPGSRGPMDHDASKAPLLGQGPRPLGGPTAGNPAARKRNPMDFGSNSWSGDRSGRMDKDRHGRDRMDNRPDRSERPPRSDRIDRTSARDRSNDRDRMDRRKLTDRPERTDRNTTGASGDTSRSHRLPQSYSSDASRSKGDRSHGSSSTTLSSSHKSDTGRGSSRRPGEFSSRNSQRNENFSGNNSSSRYGSEYSKGQDGGDSSSSYYRHY